MITINNLNKLPEFNRDMTPEEKLNPDIGNFIKGKVPHGHRISKVIPNYFYLTLIYTGIELDLKFPVDSANVIEWNR
jgi:hypothetical protein